MEFIENIEKQVNETLYPVDDGTLSLKELQAAQENFNERVHFLEQVEFRDKALEELNIINHPKAELLFDIAWDMGYAEGGLEAVYSYMSDMADLLK